MILACIVSGGNLLTELWVYINAFLSSQSLAPMTRMFCAAPYVDGHACVRSCTPESESADAKAHHAQFHTVPLLPTVFCKYLERPAGMTSENDKVTTLSKKHKRAGFLSKNRKLKCVR
ncbi:hypothetical protein VPH35_093163 [Triticum aestivum]